MAFGPRERCTVVGEGDFQCPECGARRSYRLERSRRWFLFLGLPIFPLGAPRDQVVCAECGETYPEKILYRQEKTRKPAAAAELTPSGNRRSARVGSKPQGERVLGRWDFFWYPGTVLGKHPEGVHVVFDDGDEMMLLPEQVRPLDLREGERLFARPGKGPLYRPARLDRLQGEKIRLAYDDGQEEWSDVSVVRVVRGDENHPYRAKDRVFAIWPPDGVYFPGTVRQVIDRVFLEIDFDDGDRTVITPDMVQPLEIEEGALVMVRKRNERQFTPAYVRDQEGKKVLVEYLDADEEWTTLDRLCKLPPKMEEDFRRRLMQ